MSDVEIITKDDGSPFATIEAAKSKRTRLGKDGIDMNVIKVDGGYVLEKRPYEKPKKRIPIGHRNVLRVAPEEKDPRYKYRWVNDDSGRIRMFRDAGWEVVERRGGLQVGDPDVGSERQLGSLVTKTVGKNKIAYWMRIKKEFYEEDQEAKAENIRQTEAGLKFKETSKEKPDDEGRYGKVKIGNRPEY